ncbi:MAG: hypothetical protein JWO19_6145 [Bryobacterales bacterium]|nr:hypothetical protein [Bryobacterales bacterium]
MSEVQNLEDAKRLGLKIYEREEGFSEFVEKFDLDRANPPDCVGKQPGDVCFRGNCENGQRLVLFCDRSKGCGGSYTFESCP